MKRRVYLRSGAGSAQRRLDGDLTPEEAAGLEEHLSHCPDCRALAADLEELHAAMPGLYQEPPAELKERVMAQIREESAPISLEEVRKRRSGRKVWRSWGAMAAAMAVVFMSAVAMRFGGDTTGIPENEPVPSATVYSAQPEASEPATADSLPVEGKTAVSGEENDVQTEPSVGETEGKQVQPAQADARLLAEREPARAPPAHRHPSRPRTADRRENLEGTARVKTLG